MEGIKASCDSVAAKLFRRMMLARGSYQVKSTGERIKAGLERASAEGMKARAPLRPYAGAGAGMPPDVRRDPFDQVGSPHLEGLPG